MNSKISALTSATTPLAGTETLPIVQGGATVKATVANITGAGLYPGSFTTLASTGDATLGDATTDTVTVNGYMGVGGAGTTNVGIRIRGTALTGATQVGAFSTFTATSAATASVWGFLSASTTAATAFTATNLAGFSASDITKGAGSTITNQHGVYISDQTQGTNNYGITSLVSSAANKWNIYASGTASNYMAGSLGIGTTTLTSGSQFRILNGSALNIELTSSATDATNKTGQVTISRYTNSQTQFTALRGSSTATTNSITIGGGSGAAAPATDVAIYTGTLSAVAATGTERMRVSATGGVSIGTTTDAGVGNLLMGTGNITQGTAAKGFDFSANTPLAGKTSTILNWYEEGTWTPNQGAGLTLVGAFSSTGRYTRIGRQVSISGTVTGATSVAVTAAGVVTSNLPFTVVTAGHGGATNVAINASAIVICTGTSVTSAAAIAATATITFSATYFV